MISNAKAANIIIIYFKQKILQLKININKVKFCICTAEQKAIYINAKKEKLINIKNPEQLKKHIKLEKYL